MNERGSCDINLFLDNKHITIRYRNNNASLFLASVIWKNHDQIWKKYQKICNLILHGNYDVWYT